MRKLNLCVIERERVRFSTMRCGRRTVLDEVAFAVKHLRERVTELFITVGHDLYKLGAFV
jgi:hypothetical protein